MEVLTQFKGTAKNKHFYSDVLVYTTSSLPLLESVVSVTNNFIVTTGRLCKWKFLHSLKEQQKTNISTVMFWYIHPMNVETILFYNFKVIIT